MSHVLARDVLYHWNIEVSAIQLIAQRENKVYQVTTRGGINYALRLHRPGYQTVNAIKSELLWMMHLTSKNIEVPCPVQSQTGELVVHYGNHECDLLSWLSGKPLGITATPLCLPDRLQTFHHIGQVMARVHNESDQWQHPIEFARPAWDSDGLLGTNPLWGRFWENPGLTTSQQTLLLRARDYAVKALDQRTLDYGLIHADLVRENILVSESSVQLIDFDDSGFGYRLFDIATTLSKNQNETDYPQLESALLAGYRVERPIDTTYLSLFFLLRALTYVGWIIPRLDEPGAAVRQQRFISTAMEQANSFIQSKETQRC